MGNESIYEEWETEKENNEYEDYWRINQNGREEVFKVMKEEINRYSGGGNKNKRWKKWKWTNREGIK